MLLFVFKHRAFRTKPAQDVIDDGLWSAFTYDIALLIPTHFLPFNQKLLIQEPDGSYLHTKVLNKELCVVVKEGPDNEIKSVKPYILPPFQHQTTRSESERLNPYLVCINAASKMKDHRKKHGVGTMSLRACALLEKAEKLVELLYEDVVPESGTTGAKLVAKERAWEEAEQKERATEALEALESLPEAGSDLDEARTPEDNVESAFRAARKEKLQDTMLTSSERIEFDLRYLLGPTGQFFL